MISAACFATGSSMLSTSCCQRAVLGLTARMASMLASSALRLSINQDRSVPFRRSPDPMRSALFAPDLVHPAKDRIAALSPVVSAVRSPFHDMVGGEAEHDCLGV